jgi:hypothetical protein
MSNTPYFDYNDGADITNNAFRISASQVSKFFDRTSEWYRENLAGETGFTGNTATELGNCVHAAAHMYIDTGEVDFKQIEEYIKTLAGSDIDTDHIRTQYPYMVAVLLPFIDSHMPTEAEKFVFHELSPGIVAGGSIDAIQGHVANSNDDETVVYTEDAVTLMDWKTTSAKTAPTKFSRNYWFQQMVYAWVLKQQGVNVRWIKLVYITQSEVGRVSEKTGKALKDYPATVSVVTEEVTDDNLELIGSCLKLVAESVETWYKKPELRHLLAQDMRLKTHARPTFITPK